ncbi:lasso peptide biosynthesis protein [Simulacricoccus sp. 17bor-14]|nr:lasso peptide biosynthesis protein [Simulacricoccus sp. 17bor-14]
MLLTAVPPPAEARFLFSWRGVPVGTVTLSLEQGGRTFRYRSVHLHTRGDEVGARTQQEVLAVDAQGLLAPGGVHPQALWLWHGPPAPGCIQAREELTGRVGPHCARARGPHAVAGTLLGEPFEAQYAADGELQALQVGTAQFQRVGARLRLQPPPDLFSRGLPIAGGATGALAFSPPWPPPTEPAPPLSAWREGPARALAREVHAALPDKRPSAADFDPAADEGGAGGCLAHALRFARLAAARGQRVALVHGLLALEDGRAYPHAWVRVGLGGGATLDLDPTSLDEVTPDTHLPLALATPGAPARLAGERWLALLAGAHRITRRPGDR